MERLTDKTILLACALATGAAFMPRAQTVAALLMGAAVTMLSEACSKDRRTSQRTRPQAPLKDSSDENRPRLPLLAVLPYVVPLAICLLVLAVPEGIITLPFAAYDLARLPRRQLILAVPITWISTWRFPDVPMGAIVLTAALFAAAYVISRRTEATRIQRERNAAERDRLAERSWRLEAQMRDLSSARELEVRVAVLEERSRIAREIHDNVGHLLTRAHLQAQAYQVVFAGTPDVKDAFSALGSSLGEALDTVRASVHDLHEERIDLGAQIARIAEESGLEVACTVESETAPPNVAACLCAVTREALSNAARHGSGASASLILAEHPGFWQLIIENDLPSKGAVAASASNRQPSGGMGLISLDERVRSLGGTFRAGPTAEGDTWRVFASIPKHLGQGES